MWKPFGGAVAPYTTFESSPQPTVLHPKPTLRRDQRVLSAALRMVQLRPLQRGTGWWDVAGRMEEVFCKARSLADGWHRAGDILDVAQGRMGGNAGPSRPCRNPGLLQVLRLSVFFQTKLKESRSGSLVSSFTLLISGRGRLF